MAGYYRMYRGWQDNAVFRNEAFSRRDAFVWLIENASFKPARVHAPLGEVNLQRGQLCHSLRFMAKAWKWDEAKVRRFLSSLQTAKIIDAANDAGQKLITICNYDKYQASSDDSDAANDAASTQHRRGGDAKNKEGNKGIKESTARGDDALVIDLAHEITAGTPLSSPEPGRIAEQQAVVRSWIEAGADPDMIRNLVRDKLAATSSSPRSIRWFDGAVRDAIAKQTNINGHTGALIDRILGKKDAA